MVLCQGQGPDITLSKEMYYVWFHFTCVFTQTEIILSSIVSIDHAEYFHGKIPPTIRMCLETGPLCLSDITVCYRIDLYILPVVPLYMHIHTD